MNYEVFFNTNRVDSLIKTKNFSMILVLGVPNVLNYVDKTADHYKRI